MLSTAVVAIREAPADAEDTDKTSPTSLTAPTASRRSVASERCLTFEATRDGSARPIAVATLLRPASFHHRRATLHRRRRATLLRAAAPVAQRGGPRLPVCPVSCAGEMARSFGSALSALLSDDARYFPNHLFIHKPCFTIVPAHGQSAKWNTDERIHILVNLPSAQPSAGRARAERGPSAEPGIKPERVEGKRP